MMMLKSIKSWRDKILFCINLRPSAVFIFCHAVSHCGGWGTYYYHNCGGDFPVTSPVSQLQSGVESTDNAGRGQMEIAELMAALLPSWMGEGENHAIKTLTQPLSASILLLLLINLHLYPLNMIWFCLRPPCLLFRLRTAAAGWMLDISWFYGWHSPALDTRSRGFQVSTASDTLKILHFCHQCTIVQMYIDIRLSSMTFIDSSLRIFAN